MTKNSNDDAARIFISVILLEIINIKKRTSKMNFPDEKKVILHADAGNCKAF